MITPYLLWVFVFRVKRVKVQGLMRLDVPLEF
jgi:hypothetical protein